MAIIHIIHEYREAYRNYDYEGMEKYRKIIIEETSEELFYYIKNMAEFTIDREGD